MQRSTFKVLFYVKRQSEKSGQVPIMGRITINSTMSQFSCKLTFVLPSGTPKQTKAAGKSLESQRLNEKLETSKPTSASSTSVSATGIHMLRRKVRNAFLGKGDDCRLLLQTFDEYLAGFLERVGKDRAYSRYEDYCKTPPASGLPSSNTNTKSRTLRSKS